MKQDNVQRALGSREALGELVSAGDEDALTAIRALMARPHTYTQTETMLALASAPRAVFTDWLRALVAGTDAVAPRWLYTALAERGRRLRETMLVTAGREARTLASAFEVVASAPHTDGDVVQGVGLVATIADLASKSESLASSLTSALRGWSTSDFAASEHASAQLLAMYPFAVTLDEATVLLRDLRRVPVEDRGVAGLLVTARWGAGQDPGGEKENRREVIELGERLLRGGPLVEESLRLIERELWRAREARESDGALRERLLQSLRAAYASRLSIDVWTRTRITDAAAMSGDGTAVVRLLQHARSDRPEVASAALSGLLRAACANPGSSASDDRERLIAELTADERVASCDALYLLTRAAVTESSMPGIVRALPLPNLAGADLASIVDGITALPSLDGARHVLDCVVARRDDVPGAALTATVARGLRAAWPGRASS